MKITKRQVVMIGLSVAGLAVVIRDQVRPGSDVLGPETANASVRPQEPGGQAALPTEAPACEGRKIADRLDAVAAANPGLSQCSRDAFRAPDSWLPAASPGAAAAPPVEDPDQARADAFPKKHPLQAVMVSGRARQAVIGGQCLVVGQKLDGFQLLSVGEMSVELASPGGIRVKLSLPTANKGGPQ